MASASAAAAGIASSQVVVIPRRLLMPASTRSFSPTTARFNPSEAAGLPHLRILSKPSSSPSLLICPRRTRPITTRSSPSATVVSAVISVGDKLPESTLSYLDSDDKVHTVTISDLTKGKKVVLFAVPGAFTPTCSQKHLPGFVEKAGELRAKGVDAIACVSVNDAFVMKAWKENLQIGDEVLLLSDGNGDLTRALGVELDLRDKAVGLGIRSRRYAMLLEDGVVKALNLEEGGAFTFSSADDILNLL